MALGLVQRLFQLTWWSLVCSLLSPCHRHSSLPHARSPARGDFLCSIHLSFQILHDHSHSQGAPGLSFSVLYCRLLGEDTLKRNGLQGSSLPCDPLWMRSPWPSSEQHSGPSLQIQESLSVVPVVKPPRRQTQEIYCGQGCPPEMHCIA